MVKKSKCWRQGGHPRGPKISLSIATWWLRALRDTFVYPFLARTNFFFLSMIDLCQQSVHFLSVLIFLPVNPSCSKGLWGWNLGAPSPQGACLLGHQPRTTRWHQSLRGRWLHMTAASTQSLSFNKRHTKNWISRKQPKFLPYYFWSLDFT